MKGEEGYALNVVFGFSFIHNFIIILSRFCNEPTQRPAPSWLVSSVGIVLHQYRRDQWFESHKSLNFFQSFQIKKKKAKRAYLHHC